MTVGDLAERTGVSRKTIRDLEGRGLIYSTSRSEANYRLFGEEALWCVETITRLRSLGLTLAEVEELGRAYLERPEEPFGPRLDVTLDRVRGRVREELREREQLVARIDEFRAANGAALAGDPGAELGSPDPTRVRGRVA
jgi:MerR family transcriptional regulator, copper efflux regulator